MKHITYEISNDINEKKYIGVHSTKNMFDTYLGSGKAITVSINKYGREHFSKIVTGVWKTRQIAMLMERLIVDEEYVIDRGNYNLTVGGNGGLPPNYKPTKETIRKIADANRGQKRSQETKDLQRKIKLEDPVRYWKDKTFSEEHKKKLSEAKLGKTVTEETREKMRQSSFKGKTHKQVECPHCGKSGGETGMKSWHFDNCRQKEIKNDKQ